MKMDTDLVARPADLALALMQNFEVPKIGKSHSEEKYEERSREEGFLFPSFSSSDAEEMNVID